MLTVIADSWQTQIVLTRGIGVHSILGLTIDQSLGLAMDEAWLELDLHKNTILNEENQK